MILVASLGAALLLGSLQIAGHSQEKKEPGEEPLKLAELDVKNPPGLRLELSVARAAIKKDDIPPWTAEIINDGKMDVTLVPPGDGSAWGWRTPMIQWVVDGQPPSRLSPRCGNMSPLRPNEVFTLESGQRVKFTWFEWLEHSSLADAGKHHVRLRYANIPSIRWVALITHDVAEMKRVQASTPVNLLSNEVEITIVK